jgi:transposase-like protein
MRSSYDGGRSAGAAQGATSDRPAGCPVCRSSEIVTTARTPDAESYWRCTGCGEVWNVGRRETITRSRGWR